MQTLSTVRNIRRKSRPTAGRRSRAQGQDQIGPLASCANGFLNHSFLPLCVPERVLPPREITESGYFQSVKELCSVNGLQPLEVGHLPYPYNILLSHRDLTTKLNRSPYETALVITKEDNDTVGLSTKQQFEFGHTLYYIPVIPLYLFLRHRQNRPSGNLLLAVMSYLYREAGVPYHRGQDSFMAGEYEMIKECCLEAMAEHPDDYEEDMADINRTDICSDIMLRKMASPYHLENLEQTIKLFKAQNEHDENCLMLAREALALYREFPGNHIWQNLTDLEEWDDTAACDAYISFIADGKGWQYERIEQNVNEYLGNFSGVHQPTVICDYDGKATQPRTLEYEYRVYDLVLSLCTILFDLP
ncbi:hypothetical protein C8P68_1176 [Mucilaginibacter yixingensis]|uniref:Uncharacterized protein n=1 Tax=Mucilaginibacter yixingensis TaxID=1295612 RepID=A0A2T5J4B3_9SPHI|nr:hypothetical protein [Mucilaginibacter yixingensis]PTQ91833.1 hypothetical protein C8P68_1176 [Mucilaginibacter yixingensis]